MKQFAICLVVVLMVLFGRPTSAQDSQFPNELSGYEFFQRDKLKELKLLVSTKADVARVMGKGCENGCDYNADWKIGFAYVNSGWSKTVGDVLYKPKVELVGKLASITFRPRHSVILTAENIFPDAFECRSGITTSGTLKYRSRTCVDDSRVIYGIATESVSDGTNIVLDQQITHIVYMPTKKDDDEIFTAVEK